MNVKLRAIKEKASRLPKFELKLPQALIMLGILALVSVGVQMIIQLSIVSYIQSPVLVILNGLPIFLLMLALYAVTNRIWASYLPVGLIQLLMLTVNHYKLYFLDEPFRPIDIILATEALNISQNYTIVPHIEVLLAIAVFVCVLIYLVKNVKSEKISLKIRIPALLCAVILCFGSYQGIYKNTKLYNSIYISEAKKFNDAQVNRIKGFLYSFLVNINSVTYPAPDGYSKDTAEAILSEYKGDADKKMPNVIGIMSEAFFDPQAAENIEFEINPLTRYNELKKESYYGEMIVPGFAGSTASTEFEFLTGMNISMIDKSMPSVYKTHITKNVYGLARYFKDLGYTANAIHPGHNWFYNRQNVYRRMGFDSMLFLEDLDFKPEMINYYTADSVTSKLIIDDYKKYLDGNSKNGYFNFTVTIQNHGPYRNSDAGDEIMLKRPEGMNDELFNTINNYLLGVRDAQDLLCDVKEFIDGVDEPTVIVFFGDHLPFIDSALEGYKAIGYDVDESTVEGIKRRYTTPYIICSNASAKELIRQNGGEVLVGEGRNISSNYLATELFRYVNVKPSGFFGFVEAVKEEADIISPKFMMENGEVIEENEELGKWLADYRILQYHSIKHTD